jgi:hypothetical protein
VPGQALRRKPPPGPLGWLSRVHERTPPGPLCKTPTPTADDASKRSCLGRTTGAESHARQVACGTAPTANPLPPTSSSTQEISASKFEVAWTSNVSRPIALVPPDAQKPPPRPAGGSHSLWYHLGRAGGWRGPSDRANSISDLSPQSPGLAASSFFYALPHRGLGLLGHNLVRDLYLYLYYLSSCLYY